MMAVLGLVWSGLCKALTGLPWQLWAVIGVAVLTGGAYLRGESVRNTAWEARWTAQEAAYAKVAAQAVAQNAAALATTQASNTGILNALHDTQTALTDRAADAALARGLLHAAGHAPGRCPVPEAADQPGTPATSGIPGSDSDLADATAKVLDACRRDAERLNALSAEIAPQL